MRLAAARGAAREDRADAADHADDNRADRPAGAIEVEAEGVVQRPRAPPTPASANTAAAINRLNS
jgi:hypothetical protein